MTRTAQFCFYVEPFSLDRTNQWCHNTVEVGIGSWSGGAIDGTEEAVLIVDDGYRHTATAHLTRDEVRVLAEQLNEIVEAMGDPQ